VLNLSGWRERGFYGRAYRAKQDITAADLRKRLHITLDHEVEVLEHQFARNTVDTVIGAARFLDPHTVAVESATGDGELFRRALRHRGRHPALSAEPHRLRRREHRRQRRDPQS
jgi:pyruvate/2-oxoglutarate dehydrogenase complex dihydrolipoamide dehydrogenase (E3) component